MTTKFRIVQLSIADMGFANGALTREIIGSREDQDIFGNSAPFTGGKVHQLGLKLCLGGVAPNLRLQYSDQPKGERLYVAMQPITSDDGEPRVFVISHDAGGLSLDAARARPTDRWAPDDIFVASSD